ncbi:MAG: (2Fe-2S)-binding protein [Parachlamydia sp.]|jgi:ferredoxin|nr:(2Fe-2S)-binding protein [Parachlamydia sp.]
MAKLKILTTGETYTIKTGSELLKAYQANPSLPFCFSCTHGRCGVCAIDVVEGDDHFSPRTKQEKETLSIKKLGPSHRLACQCALLGDATIR